MAWIIRNGASHKQLFSRESKVIYFSLLRSTSAQTVTQDNSTPYVNDFENCKPYSAIPGPKYKIPIVSQLRDIIKYKGKGHTSQQDAVATFGPIHKINVFGFLEFVFVADVNDVEKLHRLDGKTPKRLVLDLWKEWREKNGHKLGLLLSEGENWRRLRSPIDRQMLRVKVVQNYAADFNEVITDFVSYIRQNRSEGGNINRLDKQLFRWSLEGMAKVLYGKRLGSFTNQKANPEIDQFIQGVHDLFETTESLSSYPPFIRNTLLRKAQKKHERAWEIMFSVGNKMISEKLEEMKEALDRGEEVQGFVPLVMSSGTLTPDELYANISELMTAAVDTTSNTIQWALYHLTANPDKLQRLEEEVLSSIPDGVIPTAEHIAKMPYVKAVIKEVLRLVPIAGVVTRTTATDMVLAGYRIPAGTNVLGAVYHMGRDPALFTDPDAFIPERWLRTAESKKIHSFAWLPFGHGPRGCVGKRVAELEMHLLLTRLVQEFRLQSGDNDGVHIITKGLLQPNRPVDIKFIDRTN